MIALILIKHEKSCQIYANMLLIFSLFLKSRVRLALILLVGCFPSPENVSLEYRIVFLNTSIRQYLLSLVLAFQSNVNTPDQGLTLDMSV